MPDETKPHIHEIDPAVSPSHCIVCKKDLRVAAPLEGTPDIDIEDVLREIGSIALMELPEKVGYIFRADLVRAQL